MIEKESGAGASSTSELRGALPPGTLLRNYEVVSILGAGGFGITYRARDVTLDRFVAIKEYLPTSLALRDGGTTVLPRSTELAEEFDWGRQRFIDEARTLAKLGHAPAIVRVHDFLEANGTAYMVMALAEGETLEHRLKRDGRLSWPAIQRLIDPLLAGLEEVHSTGFLHRDIKPANILLDRAGNPTLIDFGASRAAIAGRTSAMTAIFTPGYAAAEQMTSARQGPWTDIYGLSATLYHAITGKTPPSAFERILDDNREPIATLAGSGFPRGILAGIDAGLAIRASDRPQSIEGWRTILSMTSADSDVTHRMGSRTASPPPIDPASLPAPTTGRSRRAVYLGAALAFLLVVGGYFVFASKSPQPAQAPQEANIAPQRAPQEIVVEKPPTEASAGSGTSETPPDSSAERQKAAAEAEKAAADARQKEEASAKQKAEAEAMAKADAEAKARALAQAQAEAKQKEEAEAKRAKEEEAARAQAEGKAKADADAKQKADAVAAAAAAVKEKEAAQSGEAALRLSVADRQRLQVALTALGFDTRGNDGTFGPRSREMITAWQAARKQPATGFVTAPQQQALSREAAAALAKYEEEQKKREEEKQKAVASAAPPSSTSGVSASAATASAASTPATAVSPTQPFDGAYRVVTSSSQAFRQMTVQVTNGRGSGTYVFLRCGTGKISFTISPSGSISGEADAFNTVCSETMYSVRGQAANGQLQLSINSRGGTAGGGGEVTLGRR